MSEIRLRITLDPDGERCFTLIATDDNWEEPASLDVTDVVAFGETGTLEGTDGGYMVCLVFSGEEVDRQDSN